MEKEKISWKWVTASQILSKKGCTLLDAVLVASSAGSATTTLYDGVNTTGKVIVTLSAVASDMGHLEVAVGIPLENGLYVDVGSNVVGVLVLWSLAST